MKKKGMCIFCTLHIANLDKPVSPYSLDVIISVGYRIKSQQGTNLRIWANQVLKQYMIQGYAINDERIKQLGMVVEIMKRTGVSCIGYYDFRVKTRRKRDNGKACDKFY